MAKTARLTPKQTAKLENDGLIRGKRARAAVNAPNLLRSLDEPDSSGPEDPDIGLDGDAIDIAKRGREIGRKSTDVRPAEGYIPWRSNKRTHGRMRGQHASLGPLYQSYYITREEYKERRRALQEKLPGKLHRELASKR